MTTSEWKPPIFDPIRYCVFTTVALIAWVFGAPAAVALTSALGLTFYVVAYRKGLRQSKCLIGDMRLVIAYLAIAFIAAVTALGMSLARVLG